jgi:5-methylcytosine-specific restriction protein A
MHLLGRTDDQVSESLMRTWFDVELQDCPRCGFPPPPPVVELPPMPRFARLYGNVADVGDVLRLRRASAGGQATFRQGLVLGRVPPRTEMSSSKILTPEAPRVYRHAAAADGERWLGCRSPVPTAGRPRRPDRAASTARRSGRRGPTATADLRATVATTREWEAFREWYLQRHPECVVGVRAGPPYCEDVMEVDHITPLRIAPDRKYDETNLQTLCKPHHSAKTARENGSFGRRPMKGTH